MFRGIFGSSAQSNQEDISVSERSSSVRFSDSPSKPRLLSRSLSHKSSITAKLESLMEEEKSVTQEKETKEDQPPPNRNSVVRRLSRMISSGPTEKEEAKVTKTTLTPPLAAWCGDLVALQEFIKREPSLVLSKFTVGDGQPLLTREEENDERFIPPSFAPKNIRAALKVEDPAAMTREQRWVLAKGFFNSTLLHYACAGGSLACVQLLIDQGADRHALNGAQKPSEYYADKDEILQFIWLQDRRDSDARSEDRSKASKMKPRATEHLHKIRAALNSAQQASAGGDHESEAPPSKAGRGGGGGDDEGSKGQSKGLKSRRLSRVLSSRRLSRANLPVSEIQAKEDELMSDITNSVAPIPRPAPSVSRLGIAGVNRRAPPPPPSSAQQQRQSLATKAAAYDDNIPDEDPESDPEKPPEGPPEEEEEEVMEPPLPLPLPRPVVMRRLSTMGGGQLQSVTTLTNSHSKSIIVLDEQKIDATRRYSQDLVNGRNNNNNNSNGATANSFQDKKKRAASAPVKERMNYSEYLTVIGATADGLKHHANRVAMIRSQTPADADMRRRKRENDLLTHHMRPMEGFAHELLVRHSEQAEEDGDQSAAFRRAQRSIFLMETTQSQTLLSAVGGGGGGGGPGSAIGSESKSVVSSADPFVPEEGKRDIVDLPFRVMLWQQAAKNMNKGLFDGDGRNGRALGALRDEAYSQGSKALKREFRSYAEKEQWEAIELLRNKALHALLALRKKREREAATATVTTTAMGHDERKSDDDGGGGAKSKKQQQQQQQQKVRTTSKSASSSSARQERDGGKGTAIRRAASTVHGRRKSSLDIVMAEGLGISSDDKQDADLPKEERMLTTALRRLSLAAQQPFNVEEELKALQQRIDSGELMMLGR